MKYCAGLGFAFVITSISLWGCGGNAEPTVPPGETPAPAGTPLPDTDTPFTPLNTTAPEYCPPAASTVQGLPLTTFGSNSFAGSGQCAQCHQNLTDSRGNNVSITGDWRSTMMANAAKDPLWQAKVSSETARTPGLQAVIEGKCATCHMPMARTQATAAGTPVAILGDAFLNPADGLHEAAMDGVSCTLCHQIRDEALGEKDSFSGKYNVNTATAPPNRIIYGPFANPIQAQMQNRVGYTPTLGEHTLDSGLCATCHTLYTPYVDASGEVAGEFPEQTPYLEWQASRYDSATADGKTCQDCHMPPAEGSVQISTMPMRLTGRQPFAKHYFVGGNSFMLEIMKNNNAALKLTADAAQLDATLARTRTQLAENSAEVALLAAQRQGDTLNLEVMVSNLAGHKLPTGFPSRRTWLHVTVSDASGKIIFESGKPNADGSISGNDADADSTRYEPHYRTISSGEQVQIYEAVMQDTDGRMTYTLLRGAAYAKDNRLLPQGFDPTSAAVDIAVYGAAADDADFKGGEDKITYIIPAAGEGPYEVSLALLHQPAGYRFLTDLDSSGTAETDRLTGLLEPACKLPEVIGFAAYRIP